VNTDPGVAWRQGVKIHAALTSFGAAWPECGRGRLALVSWWVGLTGATAGARSIGARSGVSATASCWAMAASAKLRNQL
jgi:hypothetical protein